MDKPNKDNLTLKDRQILESAGHKALHQTKKEALLGKKRKEIKDKFTEL